MHKHFILQLDVDPPPPPAPTTTTTPPPQPFLAARPQGCCPALDPPPVHLPLTHWGLGATAGLSHGAGRGGGWENKRGGRLRRAERPSAPPPPAWLKRRLPAARRPQAAREDEDQRSAHTAKSGRRSDRQTHTVTVCWAPRLWHHPSSQSGALNLK